MIAERWARGATDSPGDITRRELYFFNLYRCLEAVVYAALVFSPIVKFDLVRLTHPALGQVVALAYLIVALSMLIGTDRMRAQLATLRRPTKLVRHLLGGNQYQARTELPY